MQLHANKGKVQHTGHAARRKPTSQPAIRPNYLIVSRNR
jgi:hypothetical protein